MWAYPPKRGPRPGTCTTRYHPVSVVTTLQGLTQDRLERQSHSQVGLEAELKQMVRKSRGVVQFVEKRIAAQQMSDVKHALSVWHVDVHLLAQNRLEVVNIIDGASNHLAARDLRWQGQGSDVFLAEVLAEARHDLVRHLRFQTKYGGQKHHAEIGPDAQLAIVRDGRGDDYAAQMLYKHRLGRIELLVEVALWNDIVSRAINYDRQVIGLSASVHGCNAGTTLALRLRVVDRFQSIQQPSQFVRFSSGWLPGSVGGQTRDATCLLPYGHPFAPSRRPTTTHDGLAGT